MSLNDDSYCCLGVATELFCEENPGVLTVETLHDSNHKADYREYGDGTWSFGSALVNPVREWLGLADPIGCYSPKKGDSRGLWAHNDIEKLDFNAIADIIESEPKGLFVK